MQIKKRYKLADLTSPEAKQRLVPAFIAPANQVLSSTLLQGVDGDNLQAVYPKASLLQLQKLNITGPNWRAFSPSYYSKLYKRLKLTSLPPLPGLTKFTLCFDLSQLEGDTLYLESGDASQLLKFSRQEIEELICLADIDSKNFTLPLTAIKLNLTATHNDEHEIRSAVEAITSKRVEARLTESIEIAPLPLSSQELLKLKSKPDVSATELARVIETDPSLASQVISWANSPYYGASGSIRSIQDAVVRVLGFDLTMNLAIGLAMSKQIRLPKDGIHGHKNFWLDSLSQALLVEKLVKAMPPTKRPYLGLAYLAGLLYNFGYLVLAEIFPPYFSLYCRYQEANPHVPPSYLERHLFGITRNQIASYLFTTWGLPEEICLALRQQDNPSYSDKGCQYANLLFLASYLLLEPEQQEAIDLPASLFENLALTPSLVKEVGAVFHEEVLSTDLGAMAQLLNKS